MRTRIAEPDLQAIFRAWMGFQSVLGMTSVRTEDDYVRARTIIESILDEVGEDKSHALIGLLGYLEELSCFYEVRHFPAQGDRAARK